MYNAQEAWIIVGVYGDDRSKDGRGGNYTDGLLSPELFLGEIEDKVAKVEILGRLNDFLSSPWFRLVLMRGEGGVDGREGSKRSRRGKRMLSLRLLSLDCI